MVRIQWLEDMHMAICFHRYLAAHDPAFYASMRKRSTPPLDYMSIYVQANPEKFAVWLAKYRLGVEE